MRLPVSGLEVRFRAPDGNDDLAIVEAAGSALDRALALLPRLAWVVEQDAVQEPGNGLDRSASFWANLTVTDFETALLGLRRYLFGDRVSCVFRDKTHACGVRMELEFSIAAFLEEARPRAARHARRSEDDSRWYQLSGNAGREIRFRLPSVGDQLLVQDEPGGAALLARRCIDRERPKARELARAERAMETMAPLVSRPLEGNCPECGQPVTVYLHVAKLVTGELAASAAGIHDEVDRIAAAYHWDEASILRMPQRRRRAYAELIRQRERAAV